MTSPRPPLTEKIASGAAGGLEFERLLDQLLLRHADKNGYVYEPVHGAGGDGGLDGLVRAGGVPGLDGPVAFQFKYLWDFDKSAKRRGKVEDALQRSQQRPELRHWILVTPCDLKEGTEKKWLLDIPVRDDLAVHHWGQTKIEQLFALAPALYARYYPEDARALLPDYDGHDFGRFADDYRERVVLANRKLRTLGLPPETLRERDAAREIRLRDVFVPLKLVPSGEREGRPLREFLHRNQSLVVLGDPGSGKTTLLTFLALLYAGEAELDGFYLERKTVPFLVPLRDYVQLQKTKPDLDVLGYLEMRARTDHSLTRAHRAFFESTLRMGEAVVLFDGLDEAGGQTMRRRMANVIRSFQKEFSGCNVWVTSRIYGYTQDIQLPSDEFVRARVADLDEGQQDDFVERWYGQQYPHNPRECEERTDSLKNAVRRTKSVQLLAKNPLLLTLMAFIHQGLRRLPQDRGELYEKCVEMLLKTWQEGKLDEGQQGTGHRFDELDLHLTTQKDYLAHLALAIQERGEASEEDEGRGLISRTEALDVLAARHHQLSRRMRPDLTLATAREEMEVFLDYVNDRTGLLIDRGGDQLSFIHLSFQEYLTAWIFTCGTTAADQRFFREHLGDPAWEEVLLLRLYIVLRTPGGGGPEVFDTIVKSMLRTLERADGPLLGWLFGRDLNKEKAWLTLTRAVRDNLAITPADCRTILRRTLRFWFAEPRFEGEWFKALENVRLFAESAQPILQSVIDERLADSDARIVISSLHLAQRLKMFPKGAADRLRSRPDLSAIIADLVFFNEEDGMADLLAERSNVSAWTRALTVLDSPESYLRSLAAATDAKPVLREFTLASLAILWRKLVEDMTSRQRFAEPRQASDATDWFSTGGTILAKTPAHTVCQPLSGVRVLGEISRARRQQEPVSLLCPSLARQSFGLHEGGDVDGDLVIRMKSMVMNGLRPFVEGESELSGIAAEIADADFGRDFVRDFGRYFVRYFGRDSRRDFGRYSGRYFECDFVRDFGRYFGRDFVRYFGLDFVRDFGRYFGRDFGVDFGRYFGRYFGRDFVRDFVRDFGRDFVRYFGRYFGRYFVRDFGRDFGVDPESPTWQEDFEEALRQEENQLKLLEKAAFWDHLTYFWTDYETGQSPPEADLAVVVSMPLAFPVAFIDVWRTASINYFFSLCRSLAVTFPDGEPSDEAMDDWLRRYPFESFNVALTWEQRIERTAPSKLEGPRGALLLTHAAFAALMTGFQLDIPIWNRFAERRDTSDPLIEASYCFYEICRFRDGEANVRKLGELARASTGEAREVFEAAGLVASE